MQSGSSRTVPKIEPNVGQPLRNIQQRAKSVLNKEAYNYIAGTDDDDKDEPCINNKAFQGYRIVPRMLQNVYKLDTSVSFFGDSILSPILIGPCALHKLACKEGELATARAAANVNTIMALSTMSSYSLEDVAKTTPSPKWFQLYVWKNRSAAEDLIKRAEKAGYKALVLTIDLPTMGTKLRDRVSKLSIPEAFESATLKGYDLTISSDREMKTNEKYDPTLTWDVIDWIRSKTKLPIFVKGILHPDDALEAIKHQVDGIIVSNHGGRQMDSVIPTINALPKISEILKEYGSHIPLIIDGGIRSGEDIFKAIALGADAVMIARPVMFGLAVDNESGASMVLERLHDELTRTMRLAGCASLKIIRERGLALLEGPSVDTLHLSSCLKTLADIEKLKRFAAQDKAKVEAEQKSISTISGTAHIFQLLADAKSQVRPLPVLSDADTLSATPNKPPEVLYHDLNSGSAVRFWSDSDESLTSTDSVPVAQMITPPSIQKT